MTDGIRTPPDELCADCGLPYGDAVHTGDVDVMAEVSERAEIEREVARRVEEKLAEHHYFAALVEWKLAQARGDSSVPKPRSPAVDAAELVLIEAREREADFKALVDRKVQDAKVARGDAVFVKPNDVLPRAQWLEGVGAGKSADSFEVKDATFETR